MMGRRPAFPIIAQPDGVAAAIVGNIVRVGTSNKQRYLRTYQYIANVTYMRQSLVLAVLEIVASSASAPSLFPLAMLDASMVLLALLTTFAPIVLDQR